MKLYGLLLLAIGLFPCVTQAGGDEVFVRKEIKLFMKNNNVPAVAIGIIENGKVTFKAGFGTLSREQNRPITTDSFFQIGSQTKVITSIIALSLIEDGKLGLQQNIDDLLPNAFQAIDKNARKSITIERLLSHRSGLPNYPQNVVRIDGDPMVGGYSEAQLLAALQTLKLDHAPGAKFSYSNFNYAVLGYILAKVSGTSYDQLVSDYFAQRFGLAGFYPTLTSGQLSELVTPYRKDHREVATKPWDMGLLMPHGGLYSSIDGLLPLMQLQMSAYGNYLKTNQKSPLVSTQASYATGLYPGLNYGYGMFEAKPELGLYPTTVLWHGGDLDGFGCEYIFDPQRKSGIVLLTSSGGREFVMLGRKIMNNLLLQTASK